MLVDLARNDLGRVCDFGTVQVKDLMIIERYSHVMHIVSQVEGTLSADKTPLRSDARDLPRRHPERRAQNPRHADHLRTGADRARPLRRLRRLFLFQRQPGLLHHHPHRPAQGRQAYVQAGGGWVNDSTPEGEYQETVNKAKAMLKAVALAETFARQGSYPCQSGLGLGSESGR